MASSGKKGKKTKGKTVALTDFLADGGGGTTAPPRYVPRKSTWADEVENEDDIVSKEKVVLPTGPRATWGPEVDDSKIPKSPPYLAYISNLPYEVDEEEITAFFKDLKIVGVRLPRDDRQGMGKFKGFGYVEFENRQNLIAALSMPDTNIKSRRMRIDVADNSSDNDRRRGGRDMRGGDMMGRDRPDGPDRTLGDWRSGPREEGAADSERDRGGGFRDRDRDRDNDGGFDRGSRQGGARRDFGGGGFREGFGDRDRDRGGGGGFRESRDNFGDRDRGRFSDREGFDRGGFSDRRGGDRDRDRDFGRDRDRDRDSGFGSRRNFSDYGRDGGRDGGSFRGGRDEPPLERAESKSRPRLVLQPRTKHGEEMPMATAPPPPAPAPSGAPASIFGGAKPVDTAAREREIEARLAREKEDVPRGPRDEKSDDARSKSGSEHGDRDDDSSHGAPPRRMDPAPPPSENYWVQRTQNFPSSRNDYPEGNGRVSPHSEPSDHEQERGRGETQRRYQERPESPQRGPQEPDDRQQINRGPQRRTYERDERDERGGHDDQSGRDERGGQYERGTRGTPGPRGGGGERPGPPRGGAGGSERQRGRGGDGRISDREPRTDVGQDDAARMPKYHEQEIPNFAGSNKFAYLHDDEEPGSD